MTMKRILMTAAAALSAICLPAAAQDVGVSISVGEPGFYGRLDIGGYPRPAVIYREPILVERVAVRRPPIYLHVPPGHARHWRRHCHEYGACAERVYFVRDQWYEREYVPRYRARHHDRHDGYRDDHRRDGRHDGYRDHRRHDGYDGRRDDDRGRGNDR
jgi:hypothetical protein